MHDATGVFNYLDTFIHEKMALRCNIRQWLLF